MALLTVLTLAATDPLGAQTFTPQKATNVVLAGSDGTDVTNTLTLIYDALTGGAQSFKIPGNATGFLTNDGAGTLTWSPLTSASLTPGSANMFLITDALGATTWAAITTDTSLLGNGIGSPLGLNLGQPLSWTGKQTFHAGVDIESPLVYGVDSTTIVGSATNNNVNSGSRVQLTIGMSGTAGPATITGFSGGVGGRVLTLANLTGQTITLANLSGLSNPGNYIYTGTGSDLVMPPASLATLTYASQFSGWVVEYTGGTIDAVSLGGTGAGSFTQNGILYGNGANPIGATASNVNSVLVTDGSGVPSLSQTLPAAVQANISSLTGLIGPIHSPTELIFDSSAARTIEVGRNAGTDPGSGLTLQAGAPALTASSPNLTGGNLTLASGISEGTGTSSIYFQTPIAQSGASNTDNTPTTRLTLNSSQLILAADVSLLQNGSTRIDAAGNASFTALSLGTPLSGVNGGTGSSYVSFTGPTAARTYTLPDANSTLLSSTTGVLLQSSTPGTAQNGNVNLAGKLLADTIGIGTSSPHGALDVEGTFVLGVDSVTIVGSSINNNVSSGAKVSISLGMSDPVGPASISGFSGGVAGRQIKVGNITGQTVTLLDLSGLSSPGNQIATVTGEDLTLPPYSFAVLTYLPEFSAWVVEYTGGMATPIVLGGTGEATAPAALKALMPDTTGKAGQYLYLQPGGGFAWSSAGSGNGTVTSVNGSGGTTGLTLSGGPITTTGTLTLGGTLAIANGGTGATDKGAALNALLPDTTGQTGRRFTVTDTGFGWVTTTSGGGTVTSVGMSGGTTGMTFSNSPITASGSMTLGGTLNIANGGTGQTSALTQGGVVYGASATAMGVSSAGTSGQVLLSGGTGAPGFSSSVADLTITNSSIGSSNPSTGVFTSVTTPVVYGGTGTASVLNLQSTSHGAPSGDYITFTTGGSERLRVDNHGWLGIGTNTPLGTLDLNGTFVVHDDTTTITGGTQNHNVSSGSQFVLHIGRSGVAAPDTITGLTGGAECRILQVLNLTGQNLTLMNQSTGSTAANRITTGTGSPITVPNGEVCELQWDAEVGGWHVDFVGGSTAVTSGGTGVSSFTTNGILYGNGSGPIQATAAAANSVLVTDGSNVPSLGQTLPSAVQANITSLTGMTGAITYPTAFTFDGTAARTVSLNRNIGTNSGQGLTVQAGAPATLAGLPNLAGGNLTLASGISEGTSSSTIYFQTPTAGLSGNGDNTLATRLTVNSSQVALASGISLVQGSSTRIDASGNGALASLALGTASSATGTLAFANATGANSTTIQGGASAPAATYVLPTALPTTANQVLQANGTTSPVQLSWSTATSGGGIIFGGNGDAGLPGTDASAYYYPANQTPAGDGKQASASIANKDVIVVNSSRTLSNFTVALNTAPGTSKSLTLTLYSNHSGSWASTGVTVTISGTATTGSDNTHSYSLSTGDLISLRITDAGNAATTQAVWAYNY